MSKFCLQCDDGTKLKLQTKNVTVEVRGESCVVPKVTGWHCPVCGDIEYTESSGNVFADLDIDNPEEALAKSEIVLKISQPKISLLLCGYLRRLFSRAPSPLPQRPRPRCLYLHRSVPFRPWQHYDWRFPFITHPQRYIRQISSL